MYLEYGTNPEDWSFWIAPKISRAFSKFWGMVDHPERAMPGAWLEDDIEDDTDASNAGYSYDSQSNAESKFDIYMDSLDED